MVIPSRQMSNNGGDYRFGFNGKEMDNEVSGTGNQYDYGFRIYNPRLGKFLSVDPLYKSYPELTTYQFASNTPIAAIDLDGLEAYASYDYKTIEGLNGDGNIVLTVERDVKGKVKSINICNTWEGKEISTSIGRGVSDTDLKETKKGYWLEQGFNSIQTGSSHLEILTTHFQSLKSADKIVNTKLPSTNELTFLSVAFALENSVENNRYPLYSNAKKGGLSNTFNHFLGQAIIASIFGADNAEYIAATHERNKDGSLKYNEFDNKNTIDFTVDLLNNAWGREFGTSQAVKHGITRKTIWTTELTKSYFNDFQSYMGKTFGITFKSDISKNEKLVKEFTESINNGVHSKRKLKNENK